MAKITRKFCGDLGLDEDQTTRILDKIHEEYDPIMDRLDTYRDERDTYREKADNIQKQLEAAQEAAKDAKSGKTYKELYEKSLQDTAAQAARAKQAKAWRSAAAELGIPEKRMPALEKASAAFIDGIELDGDSAKDPEAIKAALKTEWADFIPEANTTSPTIEKGLPNGNNGANLEDLDMAAYIAARSKK